MQPYDVIIIGAGISGLVAGNYLVDKGKSVLILEQGPYPGGCACSFDRAGYRFDAAVHWISQAGEGGIVRQILGEFGLADDVKFHQLPGPPEVWLAGRKVAPGYGKDAIVGAFDSVFPGNRDKLVKFWEDAAATKDQLWKLIKSDPGKLPFIPKLIFNATFPLKFGKIAKYHKKKASEVISGHFADGDLCRALGIMGIFPDISFVHYSWFNQVALDGDAYYPVGGIQAVPDALAKRFIAKGGEIRYKTPVDKIIIEDKAAVGVKTSDGTEIRAAKIISASDAKKTLLNMVGRDNLQPELIKLVEDWKTSESFFYVYLGLDTDLRALGFDGRPIWYFPKDIDRKNFPMLGGGALGIGMPSVLDPGLAPEGKSVLILGMLASCAHMSACPVRMQTEGGRETYKSVKEKIGGYMIELASEAIPGIKDKIQVKVIASPHTFERYTGNHLGASSGWSMAADAQHKLPIATAIQNLYMVGHWTMNPGGVPAAFVSGKLVGEMF